ncbi:60 kDa neurofilament protein-like [Kryptolebias marmoratus]|uniref:60 kDa neurofilament protein-like n=1 Tax=Kryptolebias marmoratus TaxID=37003 RepID=UPI0007F8B734|nr:60 kDa neurofilament protein-like [Kryptolebias marmoratus]
MATKNLKEEFVKLLEENKRYKQLICQQKDELVRLEKEITAAEKRIQEDLMVPDGFVQHQEKDFRRKERLRSNNLEKETKRFGDMMHRNMASHKRIAHLLKVRDTGRNIQRKLDRQLAVQRNTMAELQSAITSALNHRVKAETQMTQLKESLDEERSQFSKKKTQLHIDIEHEVKLQTFIEKKLQEIVPQVPHKNTKRTKSEEQQEADKQSFSEMLDAAGRSDPSQICLTFSQNKEENFSLMNKITELKNKGNMLENRIHRMQSDILMLEQEAKGHNELNTIQLKDLETELENNIHLAESLDEQNQVAKRTLDELTAAVSHCLKAFREPPEVTSHNIADCVVILTENIQNLLIKAISEGDEQNQHLPNFTLLPDTLREQTYVGGEKELSMITGSL